MLGGVFGLETPGSEPSEPFFRGAKVQYFLSVRCALAALIEARKPNCAWLPSYLCPAILTPFRRQGVAIRFYGVDDGLQVSDSTWTDEIGPGDFVLAIHYFGFPNRSFPAQQVIERGAVLIEDASQALFLPQQFPRSACILYSPRKFLGVPDSGVMVSDRETGTEAMALEWPPQEWWESAVEMCRMRRHFDETGEPCGWFQKFQRVEEQFPVGLYGASDLSRRILTAVDYEAIRMRRRANYRKLLALAGDDAVFTELDADVVPLGFPVRVEPEIRDGVLRRLYANHIYAPVHWPIHNVVPQEFRTSHEISLSMITLLCDQRCTTRDMERQAREFQASRQTAREWSRERPPADRLASREIHARLD